MSLLDDLLLRAEKGSRLTAEDHDNNLTLIANAVDAGGGTAPALIHDETVTNAIKPVFGAAVIGTGSGYATITGGAGNYIGQNCYASGISSGVLNSIRGGNRNFIGGGYYNTISDYGADKFIGGGKYNAIRGYSYSSSIVGGRSNIIGTNAAYSTILGGASNTLSYGSFTFIGGGYGNNITDYSGYSSIFSGAFSTITESYNSSIVSAGGSTIDRSSYGFIGGGYGHTVSNSADFSILGGQNNGITGFDNVHIIGSNINADRDNCTFVNSISIKDGIAYLNSYPLGSLPSAGSHENGLASVTGVGSGVPILVFCNGDNWINTYDGSIVA